MFLYEKQYLCSRTIRYNEMKSPEQINKIAAVVLYILQHFKDGVDYIKLFKIMYFAQREYLATYGLTIAEDTFKARQLGPVPSLLGMGYMGDVPMNDPIYQNTRRFVWSEDNPCFFRGKAGEGIGGPHIGYDMPWPMSIMMKCFTAQSDDEIRFCMKMLLNTDAGMGFIHESFHKDDASKFTRPWFAWQNTLFGELVIKLINDGKADLLNNL